MATSFHLLPEKVCPMLMSILCCLVPTTWVVDAANGPGTNFLDLPAALAAATSGDTILVRPGSYHGGTLNNVSVTIRGAGTANTTVEFLNLSGNANTHIVLSGLRVHLTNGTQLASISVHGGAWLDIADCLVIQSATPAWATALIVDASHVTAARTTFHGGDSLLSGSSPGHGVEVGSGSTFTADACTLIGGNDADPVPYPWGYGGNGLLIVGGIVSLHGCTCRGGDMWSSPWPGTQGGGGSGVLSFAGSVLRIAGDATTVMQGGIARDGNGTPLPALSGFAIWAESQSVPIHGPVQLLPALPGVPVTLGVTLQPDAALPYLTVVGGTLPSGEMNAAQVMQVQFTSGLANAPFFFAVSLQPGFVHLATPPLAGELLLDYGSAWAIFGALDPTGRFGFSFVPAQLLGGALGVPFLMQAGAVDAATGNIRTSNCDLRIYGL